MDWEKILSNHICFKILVTGIQLNEKSPVFLIGKRFEYIFYNK